MIYLAVILGYLSVLLIVAFRQAGKVKTPADFAVAGRTLSPWVLVCTMLATWIGTGSILGNAGKAYSVGIAAMIIPLGGTLGLIVLTRIAPKVRAYEKFSVPEIIGDCYGRLARVLAVVALVIAYLVIVSYQFNAGGGVLQVAVGKKAPVPIRGDDRLSGYQVRKGYLVFEPPRDWEDSVEFSFLTKKASEWSSQASSFTMEVTGPKRLAAAAARGHRVDVLSGQKVEATNLVKVRLPGAETAEYYRIVTLPSRGRLLLWEPRLSIKQATLIAAGFIVAFTAIAGLLSVAYIDIGNGTLITATMFIVLGFLWAKAGGWQAMGESFADMGKSGHMRFWGVFSGFGVVNLCLPTFLLILGDANMYQRFFASRDAKSARQATVVLVFVVTVIELAIICAGWVSASMLPDAEEGRYVMIYAAHKLMPRWLGCIMMTNIVAIIISTADSYLLVPSTSLIHDIYVAYINPEASDRRIVFFSRVLVLCLGITAYIISLGFEKAAGFLERALYAYTIYGAAITPSLLAALFWKGATRQGAVASIISGAAVTLAWNELGLVKKLVGEAVYSRLDAVLPAITVSVACLVVVSLFTPGAPGSRGSAPARG
jgi:Na+/proline symporter